MSTPDIPEVARQFKMSGRKLYGSAMFTGYFTRFTDGGAHVILRDEYEDGWAEAIVDQTTLIMDHTDDSDMEYTPAQFAEAVDLWQRIVSCASEGESSGRRLSQEPSWPYTYPMPTRDTIGALILSDGAETLMPRDREELSTVGNNPYVCGHALDPIELTLISCGDYHGNEYDAANNRTLESHPGVTVREPNTGGHGSVFNVSTVYVGETSPFANQQDDPYPSTEDALMWMRSLVNMLEGLIDYPVFNDETLSEYEREVSEDTWDAFIRSDIRGDLRDVCPLSEDDFPVTVDGETCEDAYDLVDAYLSVSANHLPYYSTLDSEDPRRGLDGDDAVRDAYYSYEDNEWTFESATSAINLRHKDAVKYVARTVFLWEV